MASLDDIIPASLVPSSHKEEYKALQKIIAGGVASKRIKDALISDMEDILNAISRDTLKQEKLKKFKTMVNNIKETNKSSSYTSYNTSSGGEDDDRWRNNGGGISSE